MKGNDRCWIFWAAGVCVMFSGSMTQAVDSADLIEPISQLRRVSGGVSATDGLKMDSDDVSVSAKDFGLFEQSVTAAAGLESLTATAGGVQSSQIGARSIDAEGRTSALVVSSGSTGFATANGESTFSVSFDLTEDANVRLEYSLFAPDSATIVFQVLGDGVGTVVEEFVFARADPLVASRCGVLPAGEYHINLMTKGGAATTGISRSEDAADGQYLLSFGATPVGEASGDCDGDFDVDLADFGQFQLCFGGPGTPAGEGCVCVDFDGDGDVDLVDFSSFQTAFSGPIRCDANLR